MNQIKNIEIKNFKSIRHLKIEDCRRINVFVGYPNTGKSNLLEALSLFSIDRPAVDFSSFVRIGKVPTLFFDGNIKDNIEININGDNRIVGELNEDKLFFHWQLAGEGASFDRMGSGVQQKIFDILSYRKAEDNDKVLIWDSIFTRLQRPENFPDSLGEGLLTNIKKYSFRESVEFSSGKYDALAVPNGSNIFDIVRTNREISSEVKELFQEYNLELLYNSAEKRMSILKRISKDVIFTIPYHLVSDTLLRLIFYKAAVISNKDSILLFEEPEAHMFPPYISKFTSDIWYHKDNQYFISTHSPFVVNDFLENTKDELAIYAVEYKKDIGETIIKRLTEEQVHEAYQYGIDIFFNLESIAK